MRRSIACLARLRRILSAAQCTNENRIGFIHGANRPQRWGDVRGEEIGRLKISTGRGRQGNTLDAGQGYHWRSSGVESRTLRLASSQSGWC